MYIYIYKISPRFPNTLRCDICIFINVYINPRVCIQFRSDEYAFSSHSTNGAAAAGCTCNYYFEKIKVKWINEERKKNGIPTVPQHYYSYYPLCDESNINARERKRSVWKRLLLYRLRCGKWWTVGEYVWKLFKCTFYARAMRYSWGSFEQNLAKKITVIKINANIC